MQITATVPTLKQYCRGEAKTFSSGLFRKTEVDMPENTIRYAFKKSNFLFLELIFLIVVGFKMCFVSFFLLFDFFVMIQTV